MSLFTLHDESTAPEDSKPLLAHSISVFGFIPGLHAVMAEAPGVLDAYKMVHEQVLNSSFNNDEKTVVWQSVNVEHGCHYCVPAHSGIASSMGVDSAIDDALRNKTPLPTPRLEALRNFTLSVVRNRGNVEAEEIEAFQAAGFTKRHILEVVLVVSQKVMSNYINHIAETPVDKPFQKFLWEEVA